MFGQLLKFKNATCGIVLKVNSSYHIDTFDIKQERVQKQTEWERNSRNVIDSRFVAGT